MSIVICTNALSVGDGVPFLNLQKQSSFLAGAIITGGASGAVTNGAATYSIGTTTIVVAAAGTGAISNNDIVQFDLDGANFYKVITGVPDVSVGGTMVIASPGLLVAQNPTGTATGGTSDSAGYPIGTTQVVLAATGSGNLIVFDFIRFTGHSQDIEVFTSVANIGSATHTIAISALPYSLAASPQAFTVRKPPITLVSRLTEDSGGLDLDANGYVQSMSGVGIASGKTFSEIDYAVIPGLADPYYPAGQYVALYDIVGSGCTLSYSADATKNGASTPGHDVLDVVPSAGGMRITITGASTGNYIRNLRIVWTGTSSGQTLTNQQLLAAGEVFNPDFIARESGYHGIRFMNWSNIFNQSSLWATRVTPPFRTWTNQGGEVPIEVQVALCNKLSKNGWFNINPVYTQSNMFDFATLVHSGTVDTDGVTWAGLNSPLKCYAEFANEIWNAPFQGAFTNLIGIGASLYPGLSDDTSELYQAGWTLSVQLQNIWQTVWNSFGDSSRFIPMIAGQNVFISRNDAILSIQPTDFGGMTFSANTASIAGTVATITGITAGTIHSYQALVGSGILPSTYITGGSGSVWTVNRSQTIGPVSATGSYFTGNAASNVSAFATAPYFAAFQSNVPQSWTGDSDGGISKLLTETTTGGLVPGGVGAHTTTGTNSLFVLTTDASFGNGTIGSTPVNGTAIQFVAHTNNVDGALIQVDNGIGVLSWPLFSYAAAGSPLPADTIVAGQTFAAFFTSTISSGAPAIEGWEVMASPPPNQGSNLGVWNQWVGTISGSILTVSSLTVAATLLYPSMIIKSGATANTTIVSQLSGSAGGTGSYVITPAQTVSSPTAMIGTGGFIAQTVGFNFVNSSLVKATHSVPNLVGYEGGQHYVESTQASQSLLDLFTNAQSAPGMFTAYVTYLNALDKTGMGDFHHFGDIGRNTNFGYWGALTNVALTTSQKFAALMQFAGSAVTVFYSWLGGRNR